MNYAIIAAGEGSRLSKEGVELPKPLVNICGTPMIKRLIDTMIANGAESLSVIINERMPAVGSYLKSLDLPVKLDIMMKSTPSSMHSLYQLSRRFGNGKYIITTVDTIFQPEDFSRYVRAFEQDREADAFMAVTTYIDDEKPLYVEIDRQMNITAFRDEAFDDAQYISGGIYGLTPASIDILTDCMERGVSRMRNYQRALVGAGLRVKAFPMGKIVDVDHAGDIAVAERLLR